LTRFALDASVTLSWILDNPVPPYANRVRQDLLSGARAVVPPLWHAEVANVLAISERRRIFSAVDVDSALQFLDQIAQQGIETEDSITLLRTAFTTARNYALSTYDGIYLDLATRLSLPLATLDRALRSAATKAGVQLF
jgi:predicted nucleic acid-binding protein